MAHEDEQFIYPLGKYKLKFDELGKGSFGIVYKGIDSDSGTVIAAKKIKYKEKFHEINDVLSKMGKTELEIFKRLQDHKNIVELLDYMDDGSCHWFIMEFCNGGDLPHYFKNNPVNLDVKIKIIAECASAVAFMHASYPPIVHRDIKPTNVLIKRQNNQDIAKITDFGMCKLYDDSATSHLTMTTVGGTMSFMAPEFFAADGGFLRYQPGVDTFSLGLLFHVILMYGEEHGDMVPLSEISRKTNKHIHYGLEMVTAKGMNQPVPVLMKDSSRGDPDEQLLVVLIRQMTQYRVEDRVSLSVVKNTALEVLNNRLQNQLSEISNIMSADNNTVLIPLLRTTICKYGHSVQEIADLKLCIDEMGKEIKEKQKNLESLQLCLHENNEENKKVLEIFKARNSDLSLQVSNLEEELLEKDGMLMSLEDHNQEEFDKLEQKVLHKERDLEELTHKTNCQVQSLRKILMNKESEIEHLQAESQQLKKLLHSTEQDFSNMEASMMKSQQKFQRQMLEKEQDLEQIKSEAKLQLNETHQKLLKKEEDLECTRAELQALVFDQEKKLLEKEDDMNNAKPASKIELNSVQENLLLKEREIEEINSNMLSQVQDLQKQILNKDKEVERLSSDKHLLLYSSEKELLENQMKLERMETDMISKIYDLENNKLLKKESDLETAATDLKKPQPLVQQQTQQTAMQLQQRPASQTASQPTLYQNHERKGLAIIDPSTGKDISQEIAPNVQHKTATPPQSTVTEVPAPQPQQEATQSTTTMFVPNPPRGVFQHRQIVPANMSQQQNHVMGTSPANHMYQPVQTTMFVPNAAQATPYTIGGPSSRPTLYQKHERKGLAIIDSSTGKDISQEIAPNVQHKTATPPQSTVNEVPAPQPQMRKSSNREQQRGKCSEPRKVIGINREPEVVLQKAENPYKPLYKQQKENTDETKIEELYRKIRSILNKLTPQKFQILMQQILDLDIDTEEKLKGATDIIFEKAIDEPAFSVAYANACKIMATQVTVTSSRNPQEKVTFKKLLLNRCQTEFEKDKSEALDLAKMQNEIDEADSQDKKKLLQEEKDLAEAKAKRRSLGNIRFIGELFKLNMLSERIMHDCIVNLFKSTDEENLECLCRLVMTVGKLLDHDKAKPLMDLYFKKIEKIIKNKSTLARTRFMLQDLKKLRLCKWKPCCDGNDPKTIEQIHKEAAEKKVEKQAIYAQQPPSTGPVRQNRKDSSKINISKSSMENKITLSNNEAVKLSPVSRKESFERKAISLVDEYLCVEHLGEAIEYTRELPITHMHYFPTVAIQHVLERSDSSRCKTATLLYHLVKNRILSVEHYLQGLKQTLDFAKDIEIDIPKIWQYLGQLIGPMVQDGSVPLMFLKSACEPLLSCNKAGLVVSEVLKDATRRLGHVKTGEQWKSSGLQWSDFMKEEQVEEFIKQHQLEYTLDNAPLSPVGKGLSDDKIQVELNYLIAEKRMENELIFDWVDTNVGESNTKKPSFIRALMTAVCSSAIKGSMDKSTVDIGCIKMRWALLERYMDHDALLELQALFALQALVHKLQHPPDVLRILFDTLYDEDIISEDAFNQWESSEDPKEQAGKGVARCCVVQFYRWLREAIEEEQ